MVSSITLKNLIIGYRSKHQLRAIASPVHASLQAGELTCLIGANGVGKSTLLRTLAGFQPALDGEILIQDKSLSDFSAQELAREISIVLTSKTDHAQLSAEEIVGIGRSPYTGFWGTLSAADKQIVAAALQETGIQHLAQRNISELSDGERLIRNLSKGYRQRVGISQAILGDPDIIILDEPTAFLDFPSKIETLQMLRRLAHEQHKSILLSTHDVELALQLSDRLWLMEESRFSIGTPKELAADGSLSRFINRDGIRFNKDSLRIEIK